MAIKKRRITRSDHEVIVEHIRTMLGDRKSDSFRKEHEQIWEEVDRQVSMTAVKRPVKDGKKTDWHNDIELGLMGDALEVIAADVMRIAMPNDRMWFQPHIELPVELGENGQPEPVPQKMREASNGVLRSLMAQQHADTGFRDRVKLSLKEALKHGGFVAEVRYERFPKFYEGGGVEELGAPVWIPHSMWNCYPDTSETVLGTNLFYNGSMIITGTMKWADVFNHDNWINLDRLDSKGERKKDAEITKYFGDIYVPRHDGDIFVPNQEIILVEDQLVWLNQGEMPFSRIIYAGVEKDDVRDAYFTSQLVKRSPNAKAATHLINKYLDAVDLMVDPPIAYDSLDPRFAADGGPRLHPGSRVRTRGQANVKPIFIADPAPALEGYLTQKQIVEQGTGVDAIRAGVSESVEQTATEVNQKEQRAEVRTVDLVSVLERQALRPFLYMQHELNKSDLDDYPFYNNDPYTPDLLRANKSDLPDVVHFEITGARTVLGEQRRRQGVLGVAAALMGDEVGRTLAGPQGLAQIARDMFADFGVKDPERYLPNASFADEVEMVPATVVEQVQQQAAEQIQTLQAQAQQVGEENTKLTSENERLKITVRGREEEKKLLEEQIQLQRTRDNLRAEFDKIQNQILQAQGRIQVSAVEAQKNRDALLFLKTQIEANARLIGREPSERDGDNAQQNITNILDALNEFERQVLSNDNQREQRNTLILDFLDESGGRFGELAQQIRTVQ